MANNRIQVINGCDTKKGRDVAVGRAKVVDSESNAKLKVTFVKIFNKWVYAFGGDYWVIDLEANYKYAVVGALIEILWLPMILLLFLLPLFCFFFWMKEKWSLKSLFLYSFLIGIATVVGLILYNS